MMRVCPKRDALCPHGMDCPYVGEYDCTEPVRALSAVGQKAGTAPTNLCDCELGHNGIGLAGRECDCPAGATAPSGAEAACEQCGRHVMEHPQPASGFLASCGKRLTRLDECGKAQCPTPSPVVPSGLEALVEQLRAIDHMSLEDCFLLSPLFERAADAITAALARNAEIEGETIERAVRAVAERRRLLNSQFEVIDIAREDAAYEIAIEAVRSSATKQEKADAASLRALADRKEGDA